MDPGISQISLPAGCSFLVQSTVLAPYGGCRKPRPGQRGRVLRVGSAELRARALKVKLEMSIVTARFIHAGHRKESSPDLHHSSEEPCRWCSGREVRPETPRRGKARRMGGADLSGLGSLWGEADWNSEGGAGATLTPPWHPLPPWHGPIPHRTLEGQRCPFQGRGQAEAGNLTCRRGKGSTRPG